MQQKYNNNRKTFLPGPQRQIKIMQSELLSGVGCGSLESLRVCTRHASAWLLRPAGRLAMCTCVGGSPRAPGPRYRTSPAKKPPDRKLSSEDGGQGAVTWLPRLAIRLASFGPPFHPCPGPTAPPTPTPHCPHPRDSGTHPCSGRRKLLGTLAATKNLFFTRNNVLEPRPSDHLALEDTQGPGDLEQYSPLAPSLLSPHLYPGAKPQPWGPHALAPGGHGPACMLSTVACLIRGLVAWMTLGGGTSH